MTDQTQPEGGIEPATYLAHAVALAHEHGFVPASATDATPTWHAALERLRSGAATTPSDRHRARQILGWSASLRPRDPRGYRARLAACLGQRRLAAGDLPLAASAVRAFNLHLYYEIRGRRSHERDPPAEPPA